MIGMEKPRIDIIDIDETGNYAKVAIEPLERGYATTLGNSLRRILLSSMPGVAVTAIKIDGVQHEFTSIPGVKEDVTQLVLNLKGLRAYLHSQTPKLIYVNAEGPCIVTAGDIQSDSDFEVINKEMVIAHLNEGAKLTMEMTVSHGRGYVSAEKNKAEMQLVIGMIPVDSIYTPVIKTNYEVEKIRMGHITDYEKLCVEVTTNGVISAKEAISLSAKILNEHLKLFIDLSDETKDIEIMSARPESRKEKILEMSIDDLDLSVRSFNCLKRAGINTVEDLINRSEGDMMRVRNLGRKSLEEVMNKLDTWGLNLKPDEN